MSSTLRPVIIKYALPALLLCLFSFATAAAQTTSFTYQGRLTDAGALANGPYDIEFKLFDNADLQQGPTLTNEDVTIVDGSFVVVLDFGDAFDGTPRFLEIGVRPGDSVDEFTVLNPRWPITSTPYAIRSLKAAAADTATTATSATTADTATNATTADTATDATQLGGVAADQYVKTDDPRLGGEGGNFIQNRLTPQAGANFNITGNGVVGGGIGIGVAPRAGIVLDVLGTALVTPNAGSIQLGTPSSETGITISRTNRADIRFDGTTLKLVAGPAGFVPPTTNGIVITTAGNVGMGTLTPTAGYRLDVIGSTLLKPGGSGGGFIAFGNPNGETGLTINGTNTNRGDLRFDGSTLKLVAGPVGGPPPSTNGIAVNTAGNVGIGTVDPQTKLHVVSTNVSAPAIYGESTGFTGFGVYGKSRSGGFAVGAEGNASQNRDNGGFVKAMLFVNEDGTINRCFNSFLRGNAAFSGTPLASTVPCGFSVTPRSGSNGYYSVNLGFQVDDRFVSITPQFSSGISSNTGVNFSLGGTFVFVRPFGTNVGAQTTNAPFMLIVY